MAGADVMPLPPDIRAEAEGVADDLARVAASISHTQVAANQSHGVPSWIGQSADAYTESIRRLGTHARTFAEKFPAPINAIRTWSSATGVAITTTVPALWERYDQARATYDRNMAWFDGEISRARKADEPIPPQIIREQREIFREELDTLQSAVMRDYRTAMNALDDEAQRAATAIKAAQDAIADPALVAQGRDAVGSDLFNDIPLVDGQATWEFAQSVAPKMAEYVTDTDLTPEELKEFHDKYGAYLSDPFFANALAEHVRPDDMLRFAQRAGVLGGFDEGVAESVMVGIGSSLVLMGGGTNLDGDMAGQQIAFDTVRSGLLTGSGQTMDELTSERMQQLIDAGRTVYNPAELTNYMAPYGEVSGYELVSQLLNLASGSNGDLALGPGFFDTLPSGTSVAMDLVAWDHEVKTYQMLHGYEMGGPLLPGATAPDRDPMHAMYTLMDRPNSLDLDTADPALVAADRERLDSIQGFLTSDTPFKVDANWDGTDDEAMNMTRYLTGYRQSGGYGGEYYGFQDGGEAFGEAIQQASYEGEYPPKPQIKDGWPSMDDYYRALSDWEAGKEAFAARDRLATEIAGNFMYGYQDALDADFNVRWFGTSDQVDGQDVFGHTNSALRSWAGTILAPHVESLTQSLEGHYSTFGAGGTGPDGHTFVFPKEFANRLLGSNGLFVDLGFDQPEPNNNGTDDPSDDFYEGRPPAMDTLMVASKQAYEMDLREALASGASITDIADRWAPMMEAGFTAPGEASREALEALDARNARWQGLVTKGIGAVPFGDIVTSVIDDKGMQKVVNWGIGQFKSNGLPPTLEALLSTNNASGVPVDLVGRGEMAEQYMSGALYEAISTDGQFPTGPGSPAEYVKKLSVPGESFANAQGDVIPYSQMTPQQRARFEEYVLNTDNGTNYGGAIRDTGKALNHSNIERDEARVLGKK